MICSVTSAALGALSSELDVATSCPVALAREQMRAVMTDSCGLDVFCREATRQVFQIVSDLAAGAGQADDVALAEELCLLTAEQAACDLARDAATHTLQLLQDYPEEWDLHLHRKRCSSLTCAMSFSVYVDPSACAGTGACQAACPDEAILGGEGQIHVVVTEKCTKCLACFAGCPTGAVNKAGVMKPRVPDQPVPVGSFAVTGSDAMRRRRRRSE